MAVQATRQEIVRVLRKTGFTEVALSPSVSLFQPVCGGGWLRWGSVSGREEAPGRRVHDQDLLSDRELPRACLPVRRRCVHLDPCATCPPACEPRRRAAGTQRPDVLDADRGYDHDKYRRQVCEAGITATAVPDHRHVIPREY